MIFEWTQFALKHGDGEPARKPPGVALLALIAAIVVFSVVGAEASGGGKRSKGDTTPASQTEASRKPTPLPEFKPHGSMTEQFCSSARDAAGEARFAYQAERLERLSKEVDERIVKLDERSNALREWIKKREDFTQRATAQLVAIFAEMRPESASAQLVRLEPLTAAAILAKLDARAASAILNDMPADKAAGLTTILAAAATPDKSATR